MMSNSIGTAPAAGPSSMRDSNSSQQPAASAPAQPFRTDVRRTRGLQAGQILLSRRGANSASSAYDGSEQGPGSATSPEAMRAALREEEERLNKRIDDNVRSLESGVSDLVQMYRIGDKSVVRAEQEGFTAEYRADQIVRAVNGLASLGKALQLSLLLSQGKGESKDKDAKAEWRRLQAEMEEIKVKCGNLSAEVFGVRNLPATAPQVQSKSSVDDASSMFGGLTSRDLANANALQAALVSEQSSLGDVAMLAPDLDRAIQSLATQQTDGPAIQPEIPTGNTFTEPIMPSLSATTALNGADSAAGIATVQDGMPSENGASAGIVGTSDGAAAGQAVGASTGEGAQTAAPIEVSAASSQAPANDGEVQTQNLEQQQQQPSRAQASLPPSAESQAKAEDAGQSKGATAAAPPADDDDDEDADMEEVA